ncbi:hypothetical protein PoB_001938700 [Plakobranchus ocellatus]|uniref:Uncharacterized protein n=1 Tax=Plakobranchus ocellatus TaxID=259542 RepID=A0AAV3ZC37_9GAST|nr:hypothetical protein PoB_001938700 [Plakobranchus ocellatus]
MPLAMASHFGAEIFQKYDTVVFQIRIRSFTIMIAAFIHHTIKPPESFKKRESKNTIYNYLRHPISEKWSTGKGINYFTIQGYNDFTYMSSTDIF